ncbi:hypothetical protein AGOR_G00045670 [Albula goreensis]|uniref:U1-type domain-containing protein n=1 Tax=Albula goreensis TaxID=1534307 RepID=A0A8T3E4H0_9TELE|nr:hypothetical protein AGOR_G00045670 [Albula goreensis]
MLGTAYQSISDNMEDVSKDEDEVSYMLCKVCNVKIRTNTIYKVHLTTTQHIKKKEALMATGKARREPPLPEWTNYMQYLDYLQLDEPIVGLSHLLELENPNGKGLRIHCRLCNCEADMPDMTNHIVGRKHRQKYLQRERPDLITWDPLVSQSGKAVRAKAEVAERQNGRGVPEKSKLKPEASRKLGTLKVPSTQKGGKQPLKQSLKQLPGLTQLPPQPPLLLHGLGLLNDIQAGRSYLGEDSYGWDLAERRPEDLRGRSQEVEGGYHPHGNTYDLPADAFTADCYGDGMVLQRRDYDEANRGVAYPEEHRRGGAYELEKDRGGGYKLEKDRGGVYEDDCRRGGAFEEDYRRGGAYEEEHMRGRAFEEDYKRGGACADKGRDEEHWMGEVYGYRELSIDETWSYSRERLRSHSLVKAEADGPLEDRERQHVSSMMELPDIFKRFLSGAAEKRSTEKRNAERTTRASRFSEDAGPAPHHRMGRLEEVQASKRLKLDPLSLMKEDCQGKESRSSDMLDVLKMVDIDSVEDANFIKEKLCTLLKDFQANKFKRKEALRSNPSGFYKDYDHQHQGPQSPRHSSLEEPFTESHNYLQRNQKDLPNRYESHDQYERAEIDLPDQYGRGQIDSHDQYDCHDRYDRGQKDSQDRYERGQRDSLVRYELGQRDSRDRYELGQRDSRDRYDRVKRDSLERYERGQRGSQAHSKRSRRDSDDQYERGQRDSYNQYEREGRDLRDRIERGQRDSQDGYEREGRDLREQYERGQRHSQDGYEREGRDLRYRIERGQRDSQDGYEREGRDLRDRIERGQRHSQDGYQAGEKDSEDHHRPPTGSYERLVGVDEDPRFTRSSYEDVFGKTAPDPNPNSARHSDRNYPQSSSGYRQGSPDSSATLDKITSTLLQLVAHKRHY